MAVVEGWEKSKIGMLKGERARPVWVLSWGSPVKSNDLEGGLIAMEVVEG